MMLSICMCCAVLSRSAQHGILQARILDWVVMPFSRVLSQPRDQAQVSHIAGRFFTIWASREAQVFICAKVGSQETPGVTGKFGLGVQNEAGRRLLEFCQENAQVKQTPSSNNTREDSTHGHHQMVNTEIRLIIFFAAKDGEALYSQQKQDQELTVAQILIAKFKLKLKKVGKTTRPFRYDLNQIPYDYTVEVRNRFKGLNLMNYGWRFMTLYRRQGSRPSPWKRNAIRQNGCLRRPYK